MVEGEESSQAGAMTDALGAGHAGNNDAEWNPSPFFVNGLAMEQQRVQPYALVLLNVPIGAEQRQTFTRLWQHATRRYCADGGANRLYDLFGRSSFPHKNGEDLNTKNAASDSANKPERIALPHLIKGDLDSLRDDVRDFFSERGVSIVHAPSQYATDLQKTVQAVEDFEASGASGNATAHANASELDLIIFGGLSGRLDQTIHTLHVLWQLCPGTAAEEGVRDPGEDDAQLAQPQLTAPDSAAPSPEDEGEEDETVAEARGGRLRKRKRTWVVGEGSLCWLLAAGTHTLRMDRSVLGKTCGILPLGVGLEGARVFTQGLEWDLAGERTTLGGFLSTSNHLAPVQDQTQSKNRKDTNEAHVTLRTDRPVYWTVELKCDTD